MASLESGGQIITALQQWPANQETTIAQLTPLADSGDKAARAVLAYLLGPQTGRWPEGLPYARAAVADDGQSFLAYIYGANLVSQPDAALRAAAADFMQVALEDQATIDPFGPILTTVQQGDATTAETLLALAVEAQPSAARKRWEDLLADVASRRAEVDNAAVAAATERDRVLTEMNEHLDAVSEQRHSVERVANQLGVLASRTAGGAIAQDYAHRAEIVERTATRYTWASILLALLIAVGATIATLAAGHSDLLDDAASKAAVGIPLVALNLYLGRLAAQYRQEAVQLRHIELQFNTANPYLADLDEDRRKEVLAQLAPRFFPGQALPGAAGAGGEPVDVSQLLTAALIERLVPVAGSPPRGAAVGAPEQPASPSSEPSP